MAPTVADLEYAKILPDVDSESGPERPYAALDDESQTAVINDLEEEFGSDALNSVLGPLWDWKRSSYGNYAKTHERLFRGLHGIDAPPRNGDLRAISPTEQQLEIASRLSTLSQDFLRETYGDRITVFRGITRTAPTVLAELFEKPDCSEYAIDATAVTNYTTDIRVAGEYGLIVLTQQIDVDDIVLAPDFILKLHDDGEVAYRDAEVRVNGDAVGSVSRSNILFPSSFNPIDRVLKSPERLSMTEHEEVATLVLEATKRELQMSGPDARRSLWNWFDCLVDVAGLQDFDMIDTVDESIRELCGE